MGKNMARMLRFAIKYQGWQTYGKDRATTGALNALENHGFIEVNRETRQFRLDQPNDLRVSVIKDAA